MNVRRSDLPLGALLFVGVGFTLGYVVGANAPPTNKDAWDVATALGTVLAVVVALWFGVASLMRQSEQAEAHAALQSLLIVRPLSEFEREVFVLDQALGEFNLNDSDDASPDWLNDMVFEALSSAFIDMEPSDLLALAELDATSAVNLARAVSALCAIRDRHDHLMKTKAWGNIKPETKTAFVQTWRRHSAEALKCIHAADASLGRASARAGVVLGA